MPTRYNFNRFAATTALAALACSAALAGGHEKKEGINVGPGEMGFDGVIVEGPPITADQVMSDSHATYPRGMTCAECHSVDFDIDFVTTASKQFVNNFANLEQAEIWEKVEAFLPGRERFAIATVEDNMPTATTVDMVLDQEQKAFYVVSERGTEKLLQLRKNPNISAVRFAGWTVAEGGPKQWRSVQLKGTAEVIESTDPRFGDILDKYNLVRVGKERAFRRFDIIKVTPRQIYYFDTTLGADGYSPYQLWLREGNRQSGMN